MKNDVRIFKVYFFEFVKIVDHLIGVKGGDSSGNSGTGETPQIAKRPRSIPVRKQNSLLKKKKPSCMILSINDKIDSLTYRRTIL
jgi:hypothetical protein